MYEDQKKQVALRLSQLRNIKNVSARDMSLSLGQNPSYINNIENNKALPSMTNFFYICDYLHVTPEEFFSSDSENPALLSTIIKDLKKLNNQQLHNISCVIKDLIK